MAKKRVHELAKDLGFQNNRDLIEKLQKLGFDVKSHSSTLDEDEVRTALRRADDDRKGKPEERRPKTDDRLGQVVARRPAPATTNTPSPLGAVVARRPAPPDAHTPTSPPASAPVVARRPAPESARPTLSPSGAPVVRRPVEPPATKIEAKPPRVEPKPEPKPVPRAEPKVEVPVEAPKPQPVETQASFVEPQAHAEAPVAELVEPSGVETTAEAPPAPPVIEEPVVAATSEIAEAITEPVASDDDDELDSRKERREARAARPEKKREEEYDEEDEKPELEDFGISELDFVERPDDNKSARVAPPPPSTIVAPKKEEVPQTRVVRQIDPNVLKARLKQSKRPEPPKEWGKQAPEVAASPVTELVVRTDASGKKKELVDVRKEAAKSPTNKKTGARRREEMSAKDLLEHRRGQVYYPTPTRKKVRTQKRAGKRPEMSAAGRQPIEIGDTITISELSQQMSVKATEIIGFLFRKGVMATINQPIDHEAALMVCAQFGFEVDSQVMVEEDLLEGEEHSLDESKLVLRPPVVTVMGHVDHGKTSLLDRIRKANVAAGEAGGITQRIAGYQVNTAKGSITFLDTPGHAAFTAMRARGANVTDIVVLVVAADDGVMPQTREAIDHARAAEVPLIVALNKIDKPEANPDRVLQQLADQGVLVEEWGGDVLCRRISAKSGSGVDELLELIALQSEILELRANPETAGVGTVIEGHIDKGRGPVATVLIEEGTLRLGDVVVVGENIGRVRAMHMDAGRKIKEAGPATPVEILGLDGVPQPGDRLRVAQDLDGAKEIAAHRRDKRRASELSGHARVSLHDLFARVNAGEQKELRIIIKADVQGSVEALKGALLDLSTGKVKVAILSGGVGAVTESDVEFATASEAIIIGYGVRPDTNALKSARALGIDIRSYDIIYEAVDEVKRAMRGLLAPVQKEKYLGRAEVRQIFNVPKVGTIAGCAVVDGTILRSANIRLLRDAKPIFDGKLSSLKRFKDDAREVKEGFECGMGVDRFNDLKVGDIIECYEIVMTEAALDEPLKGSEARA